MGGQPRNLMPSSTILKHIEMPTSMMPFMWFSSPEKYVATPQTAKMRNTLLSIRRALILQSFMAGSSFFDKLTLGLDGLVLVGHFAALHLAFDCIHGCCKDGLDAVYGLATELAALW